MNTNAILWAAGAVLMLVTLGQWIVLRSRYLDGLNKQRTRHALQLQTAGQHIEQAKRQIAQLQLDLTGARSQLARIAARQHQMAVAPARPASDAQAARRDAGVAARRGEPFDGFADTLPALQYPHDPGVLATYPRSH
ncbi:hypothetical protein [Piscinibacter gummiphilus]|uniref:DUF2570 domain-containing protein n=1 Tax=Piscinibacter gummiphilus TaxID=946333 RepID=A0ABZ0CXE8_9BURK|nr:hypothetical protein [Piscinibacter gummiphilus]WOB09605.1 hypothetical protein RXV79_05965 [Piscinibacter gummiphilus]